MGSVLVLQALYDLSDGQAADAVKFDIRWKVACGRSLTQMSFNPSTLVYWRKRIARSPRPGRVFDVVAEVIAATGILRGKRKRVIDSTVPGDAFQVQVRMLPWFGGASVSVTTMAAIQVGGDRVTVAVGRSSPVWVDGVAVTD